MNDDGGEGWASAQGGEHARSVTPRSFGEQIRSGQWLLGTVVSSPDPVLAEQIAPWFDFVWIDLEHSALSTRDAQTLAITVAAGGAASLVRLASSDSDLLGAVLDAGVDGIVAPRVESGMQAAQLVRKLRYPPSGVRGFAPRRATQRWDTAGAIRGTPDVVCMVQIESQLALSQLDAIAQTEGVDALIVGTADLSFDLGSPLDVSAPALVAAIERTAEVARQHSKAWGIAIGELPSWIDSVGAMGGSLLVFSSDVRMYTEAIERRAEQLRALQHVAPRRSGEDAGSIAQQTVGGPPTSPSARAQIALEPADRQPGMR